MNSIVVTTTIGRETPHLIQIYQVL